MCSILKTADHSAKMKIIWDSVSYRVLFMSDCLSSVWGHSVHLTKFPMLRFSKGYSSGIFHPISSPGMVKYGYQGGVKGYMVLLFGDLSHSKLLPDEDKSSQLHCL